MKQIRKFMGVAFGSLVFLLGSLCSALAAPPAIPVCTETETKYPLPESAARDISNFWLERKKPLQEVMKQIDEKDLLNFKGSDAAELGRRKAVYEKALSLCLEAKNHAEDFRKLHRNILKNAGHDEASIIRGEDCLAKGMEKVAKTDPLRSEKIYLRILEARTTVLSAGLKKITIAMKGWKKHSFTPGFSDPGFEDSKIQDEFVEAIKTYDEAEFCFGRTLVELKVRPDPFSGEDQKYLPKIDCSKFKS